MSIRFEVIITKKTLISAISRHPVGSRCAGCISLFVSFIVLGIGCFRVGYDYAQMIFVVYPAGGSAPASVAFLWLWIYMPVALLFASVGIVLLCFCGHDKK